MPRRSLLLALFATSSALTAQAPDSTSLPRVVVTATRVSTPLGAGLIAATVLDGANLARSGVRDVAEALRLVPGVSIVRSGGPGAQTSVFLRGGENDYVRVLVDGVPLNEPGGAVDLGWLSIDQVDRIEVVRGPASVLYGTDAVSGVIQIFTRQGNAAPHADLELSQGRYETVATSGTVGIANHRGGLLVGAARDRSDGLLPLNNQYDRSVLTAALRGTASQATRASLTLRGINDEFHYPTDGAGNADDVNALRRGRRLIASATAERMLTARTRLAVSMAAMNSRGVDDDRADSPSDTLGGFHYDAVSTVRRRVADLRLTVHASPSAVFTTGVELARESQRGNDSSNYSSERAIFAAAQRTTAVYAQWLAESGPVSVIVGARLDDSDAFGFFRTWRSGATLRLTSRTTARATLATAFKGPSFVELFNTAYSTGNPDLVPERSRNWEIGLRQATAGERVILAATWFDQRFRDMIQYAFLDPDRPNYFNVAAARARGLELELDARLTEHLRTSASTTFLKTLVTDEGLQSGESALFVRGKRLLRRPSVVAAATVSADLPGTATADLTIRHTGARDDRDFGTFPATPVTLPAYTKVDLHFTGPEAGTLGGAATQLRLRLENVFGSRYQEVLHYPAPGRTLVIGVRLRLE